MASRLVLPSVAALRPAAAAAAAAAAAPALRRTFAVSSSRHIKESSADGDKDYEKHKQDSLQKQKSGQGHWKPELASRSEEAVKADRSPKEDFSKLQERTKEHAQDITSTGTSAKDPM